MMGATPSSRIVASAEDARTVTDADGRRLHLRRMNALDRLRLFKAAGPLLSQNAHWLGMASLACSVTAIDDVPLPAPGNEQQIEGLVSRLGDSGINAVAQALHRPEADPPAAAETHAGN